MKINELKQKIPPSALMLKIRKKRFSLCKYMKRDSLYSTSIYLPIHETCSFVSGASKGVASEVSSKSAGDIQPGQNKFLIEIIIIGLR